MDPSPVVSAIAHQIELSVAPVFLLAGVGAILNVLANRLARVVERARELAAALQSLDEAERARALGELQLLTRRIKAANLAIVCCTTSACSSASSSPPCSSPRRPSLPSPASSPGCSSPRWRS